MSPADPTDRLTALIRARPQRLAMPILSHPGAGLIGATVRDVVTSARIQAETQRALHGRFRTPVVFSAMDLSVEAEAFGAEVRMSDHEIPTVVGRRVTSSADVGTLQVPVVGEGRTAVYLDVVRQLRQFPGRPVVLAGCIGPFSLAGRLLGVSEILGMTLTDPALVVQVVEKAAAFLAAYARAFATAGADGLIMAEPTAGLLSPKGLAAFSSAWVRRIVDALGPAPFAFILHNCAAKLVHLPAILEAGPRLFHFGAPMDLAAALGQVDARITLCGNLDPATVFCQATPDATHAATRELLAMTRRFPNFILSSGCDVPPAAPLANIEAFFQACATADQLAMPPAV